MAERLEGKEAGRFEKLTSVACSFVLGVCKHNRLHLSSLTVEKRSGLTVAGRLPTGPNPPGRFHGPVQTH